jgi:ABC-type iron transport system FetAB ATPase subunit
LAQSVPSVVLWFEIKGAHLAGLDAGREGLPTAKIALHYGLFDRIAVKGRVGAGHDTHQATDAEFRVMTDGTIRILRQSAGNAGPDAFRVLTMLAYYDECFPQIAPASVI